MSESEARRKSSSMEAAVRRVVTDIRAGESKCEGTAGVTINSGRVMRRVAKTYPEMGRAWLYRGYRSPIIMKFVYMAVM